MRLRWLLLSRLYWRLCLGRIPLRLSPWLPCLSRPVEAPEDGWRLQRRRQRLSWHLLVLPAMYRVVEWWWWTLPRDRRAPCTVWLGGLLLLLLQCRTGTLRKLTLCTWELSVDRGCLRYPKEPSDKSKRIARTDGTLLRLRHAGNGYGTWTRSSGTRLALSGRLVLRRLWVGLENGTATEDVNQ